MDDTKISATNNGKLEMLLTEMEKVIVGISWGRSKKFLLGCGNAKIPMGTSM